ncbi:pyridoxamine 5'-phosphate oxidase family protein [Kutzneria kofuensis]|uniref:Pyridoxamine 5'-phosphate oxidase N-terminal domain-containing protein n=1 Tax=Kutzneria kofuensis TaxID=103725 RepID=A0A7W9NLP9_9PSEU|nr:pyridoxamine 5'-phosphate oxidase family protein [Kutzneria kofuensis]MBB5897009.1 hypothetical protein [Kutzneria kofuensis]
MELPEEVTDVFERTLSCEMTTLSRTGPVTWPMVAMWKPEDSEFVLVTGVALPRKLHNLHRDNRIGLLFSDFTGSGLVNPPQVLVQGRATVPDELLTIEGLEDFWDFIFRRRPSFADEYALDTEQQQQLHPGLVWRIRVTVTPERVWAFRRDGAGTQNLERVA